MRQRYRALRESMAPGERRAADARIAERLLALPAFRDAGLVLAYLSVGAEVDTRAVIHAAWEDGKAVAAPRCIPGTREMEWHELTGFEGLVRSSFGIEEPADDPATVVDVARTAGKAPAVAFVPGLSFDGGGYRLGYGGGFYDVFLSRFTGTSIGLCRARQLSASPLPRATHDVPVDLVITDA